MNFYEKLPSDFLINFYNEIIKNIEKGILSKNMYYELGLIISALLIEEEFPYMNLQILIKL